jgi:hypothetical protein
MTPSMPGVDAARCLLTYTQCVGVHEALDQPITTQVMHDMKVLRESASMRVQNSPDSKEYEALYNNANGHPCAASVGCHSACLVAPVAHLCS